MWKKVLHGVGLFKIMYLNVSQEQLALGWGDLIPKNLMYLPIKNKEDIKYTKIHITSVEWFPEYVVLQ